MYGLARSAGAKKLFAGLLIYGYKIRPSKHKFVVSIVHCANITNIRAIFIHAAGILIFDKIPACTIPSIQPFCLRR